MPSSPGFESENAISSDVRTYTSSSEYRSRIHEGAISLRFLGILLRVLILEVSVFNDSMFNPNPD
jgi:hypothetical protein